jgi:uncharacterized membrane protein
MRSYHLDIKRGDLISIEKNGLEVLLLDILRIREGGGIIIKISSNKIYTVYEKKSYSINHDVKIKNIRKKSGEKQRVRISFPDEYDCKQILS